MHKQALLSHAWLGSVVELKHCLQVALPPSLLDALAFAATAHSDLSDRALSTLPSRPRKNKYHDFLKSEMFFTVEFQNKKHHRVLR